MWALEWSEELCQGHRKVVPDQTTPAWNRQTVNYNARVYYLLIHLWYSLYIQCIFTNAVNINTLIFTAKGNFGQGINNRLVELHVHNYNNDKTFFGTHKNRILHVPIKPGQGV